MPASSSFQDAANYLSSASSLSSVSNTVKLELYGLFKYLTVSHAPNTSRPSIFDFSGRAKWDAWDNAGKTYGDNGEVDAERRYLEIAKELGWKEGTTASETQATSSKGGTGGSNNDTAGQSNPSGGGGMGMGVKVSTMTTEGEGSREGNSIHGFAIAGDTEHLKTYLQTHPNADVNKRDEYGYTPLHLACDRGHLSVVKLLLEHGADRSIKDPDDLTALELASIAEHDEIVAALREV
ncbi:ankyrin [Panus rudis PR-1116 ss-1]|nr:ankyrin [Panus rudis PR-1116 ss-1]